MPAKPVQPLRMALQLPLSNINGLGVYMVANVVIVALVALGVVLGTRRAMGAATGRRDCCSGKAKPSARRFREVRVTDKDESHYPYAADLSIAGMTCEGCARNVTRALDSVGGTWAEVSFADGSAHVRSKAPIDEAALRGVVDEAGYRVLSCEVA